MSVTAIGCALGTGLYSKSSVSVPVSSDGIEAAMSPKFVVVVENSMYFPYTFCLISVPAMLLYVLPTV